MPLGIRSAWIPVQMSRRPPRAVMVLGTTSGAGKSFLTTALCRLYAREGYRVAPFKAQNMSNNARVVEGGEIGSAQYFQARAARAKPEVRMNPILLKPEADTRSQVVVLGQVRHDVAEIPWKDRRSVLWPCIRQSLHDLLSDHEVIVIEGAGSPTEINLMASDLVNLPVAREVNASTVLITDIDRGGAFAHLYGTYHYFPAQDRTRLRGFVLNRFRGDPGLLEPGPSMLEQETGIPTLATLPLWRAHGLPEEDALAYSPMPNANVTRRIAVIATPFISNHDEFQPLINLDSVQLIWVRTPSEMRGLNGEDWVILPGSKQTQKDLAWIKAQGLDVAIHQHALCGGAVLGICGGLQMLGDLIEDPTGNEADGSSMGLGLLPLITRFHSEKVLRQVNDVLPQVQGVWNALSGLTLSGYEIHHGVTALQSMDGALELIQGRCFQNHRGNVLGLYCHGLFESEAVIHALFGQTAQTLDEVFDGLSDFLLAHGGRDTWLSLLD